MNKSSKYFLEITFTFPFLMSLAAAVFAAISSGLEAVIPYIVVWLIIYYIFYIYMLPTIIAGCRGHRNRVPIFILNLFLGATIFGWVGSLIWAFL